MVVSVQFVVGVMVSVRLTSGGVDGGVVVCGVYFGVWWWCVVVGGGVGGGVGCVVAIGVGWNSGCVELVGGAMFDGWVVGGAGFVGIWVWCRQ
jgi:hypothetical protein